MRTMIAACVVLIASALWTDLAEAWSVVLSWASVPTATTYKVEKSVDMVTWIEVTAPTARPTTPIFTYTGTETGTVHFRFSNCNTNGCTTRPQDGSWHNDSLSPPPGPLSITTQ